MESSPRIGILSWQLATVSAILSFATGAGSLCLTLWSNHTPAVLVRTCFDLVAQGDVDSPMILVGSAGVFAAAAVSLRIAYCAGRAARAIRRERSRLRRGLAVVARCDPAWPGTVVIDRPEATAFCLPGRRGGTVVLSTGALSRLSPPEVQTVLAHERAHLQGHHDVVVWAAQSLREAFPFVPLFTAAAAALPGLVEMAADDVASRASSRRVLAFALLRMADVTAPASSMGVGGSAISRRVRRLLQPTPSGRVRRTAAVAVGVILLVAPMATFASAVTAGCRLGMTS